MRRSRLWSASIATALLVAAASGNLVAATTDTSGFLHAFETAPANRGWITVGVQMVHTQGSLDDSGSGVPFLRTLETDTRSMTLGLNYRLGERWLLHASLPYIRKRAVNDVGMHNPLALAEPRPDSQFLDDGAYHGTWQDWQLGVTWLTQVAGFDIAPHAVLTYPSRDYTFFASAAAGQRLTRLRLGADVSRRLGRSNFHYSAGYSYEFVERVLGNNLDKHHFRLSGHYDFSPQWSMNAFVNRRRGQGGVPSDFFAEAGRGSEIWYQHDRLLRQNHGFAGVGATWRFNETWSIAASTSRMVWGDSMHDVRYAHELRLTRGF